MNFKELNLSDVIKEIIDYRGKTPKKLGEKWSENGIRALSAKNIKTGKVVQEETIRFVDRELYKKWMKQEVERGTILITSEAPFGEILYWNSDEKIVLSQRIFGVKIKSIYNSQYIYYYMTTKKFKSELNARATGSTVTGLRQPELLKCKIKIPEKEYQDKIVKILSNIDNKIQLNNQINDNLLKVCNSIFHYYIEENEDIIDYKRIVDIAEKVVTGKTPSTKNKDLWREEIPFITIPDMHNQVYTITTERKISKLGAKSVIPKNSISVSCIATVGLVSINIEDSQTNQQINSIVLKNEYDLFYLFEYLSEQEDYLKNIAGGSTTYNINKNMFENIEIPYLSVDKMQEFHRTVKEMFEKIKENQLENRNLEKLRDTVLPKLMKGEIVLDNIMI